jgi:hypothetical protein
MIDDGGPFCSRHDETIFPSAYPLILTLETPSAEEIARVIWERQHNGLPSDAISHNAKWRDQSIPSRFWDEFLLDADAVLLLFQKKHIEYQNARN